MQNSKNLRVQHARMLQVSELTSARDLCAQMPVESVLVASRISAASAVPSSQATQIWGFPAEGPLEALCWIGANVVPVALPGTDHEAALDAFAAALRTSMRTASSFVGEQSLVLGLWSRVERVWSKPREIRREQPSLAIARPPDVEPDPLVRLSRPDELPLVLPACVEMFTEEVGYSPLVGSARVYSERVRSLITSGRSFIRRGLDGIEFKAEVGALGPGIAQLQGVWVPPELRGRGLAAPGMAAVVAGARTKATPLVALYVNSYNSPALATYRRVGFEQVGTFTTILF